MFAGIVPWESANPVAEVGRGLGYAPGSGAVGAAASFVHDWVFPAKESPGIAVWLYSKDVCEESTCCGFSPGTGGGGWLLEFEFGGHGGTGFSVWWAMATRAA